MNRPRPLLVKPAEPKPGAPAFEMRRFFDREGRRIGWTGCIRNRAADTSSWHRHPDNDTFVYIIRGSVTIEFGVAGRQNFVAQVGDFVYIPAGVIHREVTGGDDELEAIVVRIGPDPEHVDVEGPEHF